MNDKNRDFVKEGYEISYDASGLADRWRNVTPPGEGKPKNDSTNASKKQHTFCSVDKWDLL